jgi:hypothetical protein
MISIELGYMSIKDGNWRAGYDYDNETDKDLDPNEIIIKKKVIQIKYDYPLSVSHKFEHQTNNSNGFTRKELCEQIMKHYKDIYNEEEENHGNPGNIPRMLNRRKSNGPHGIWGHHIDDLYLHTLYYKNRNYTLGIDS